MTLVNPHFDIHTPVIHLLDYLDGPVEEGLNAYTVDWITRYPNMVAAQLINRPRFLLTFLDDRMVVLNLLSQHPELLHNEEFQTKYGFIYQELENVRKSIQQGADANVLLAECHQAMELMGQVCQSLNNLDPNVALVQNEGGPPCDVHFCLRSESVHSMLLARQRPANLSVPVDPFERVLNVLDVAVARSHHVAFAEHLLDFGGLGAAFNNDKDSHCTH